MQLYYNRSMIYIIFSIFTLLIFAFALYQWQYFMIFSPIYYGDREFGDSFEILSVSVDSIELEGVVYEPENIQNPQTVLFFAGRSHDSVSLIKKLAGSLSDVRIITFNYRSYGRSGGVASEKNILSDGVKIANIIRSNYGEFHIMGFSLGSSVAAYVASEVESLGVFLIAPFDSISQLTKAKYGINLSPILRYRFDNRIFVSKIDAKTYIFCSKSDTTTYIDNTRNLKKYVKNLALFREYDALSHKDVLWNKDVLIEIKSTILRAQYKQ